MSFPGADNAGFAFKNGFCTIVGSCAVNQNCTDNTDCGGDTVKCFKDIREFEDITQCLDTAEALFWGTLNFYAAGIIGGILLLHVLCIGCKRLLDFRNDWKRRISKREAQRRREAAAAATGPIVSNIDFRPLIASAELDADDSDDEGTMSPERAAELTALKQGAEEKRNTILGSLNKLLDESLGIIASIREEASFVKVDTNVLLEERFATAAKYRVILLTFARRNTFVALNERDIDAILKDMAWIDLKLKQCSTASIRQGDGILKEVNERILALDEDLTARLAGEKTWDLEWDLSDPDYQRLQARVYQQLHPNDEYYKQMTIVANTPFSENENIMDELKQRHKKKRSGLCKGILSIFKTILRFFLPGFIYHYLAFYFLFYLIPVSIFAGFLMKIGRFEDNDDLQNSAILGSTFLPVPGYYDLKNIDGHKIFIPLIYSVMHCALYCLCWIPVPFMKGILRDMSLFMPKLRQIIPIDDAIWFHKWVAIQLLFCLFVGGCFFFFELNRTCSAEKSGSISTGQTCLAFDPIPPAILKDNNFKINPVQNVYMLRKIVWSTWFIVFPMLHWANTIPRFAPNFLKQYWYEIWFYAHHFTAHFSAFLALIARFEVFYPTLIPWSIYYLDKLREAIFKTARTEIIVRPVFIGQDSNPDDARTSTVHMNSKNQPNSMRILIEVPPVFKVYAGQWIYLKIPEISVIQWHPFSLASAARDNYVELHIGIRGDKSLWQQRRVTATGETDWVMTRRPTWTYKLYRLLRTRIKTMAHLEDPERQADSVNPLFCMIRGPYGSTFTKCFDPHYYGSIIIGAGTGLTAAESVLRELIWRKRQKLRVPKFTWFVWSCSRVDDLLWAWGSLHSLLLNATEDGILNPGKKWTERSLMLDWLGIYFYVSRADKNQLQEFTSRVTRDEEEEEKEEDDEDVKVTSNTLERRGPSMIFGQNLTDLERQQKLAIKLHKWMSSSGRLFTQSLDDKEAHVEKLFAWCRLFVNRKAGRHKKIALCFCGPTGLAHTLNKAAYKIGGADNMEFSADSQ